MAAATWLRPVRRDGRPFAAWSMPDGGALLPGRTDVRRPHPLSLPPFTKLRVDGLWGAGWARATFPRRNRKAGISDFAGRVQAGTGRKKQKGRARGPRGIGGGGGFFTGAADAAKAPTTVSSWQEGTVRIDEFSGPGGHFAAGHGRRRQMSGQEGGDCFVGLGPFVRRAEKPAPGGLNGPAGYRRWPAGHSGPS